VNVFQRCRSFIAEDKIEKAFLELEKENLSSSQRGDLTSIRYRYKKLESDDNRKLLTRDEYYTGLSKITHDFIAFINEIEAAQLKKANTRTRSRWWRLVASALAINE
ncbi:MAG: hypothetical protein KDD12_03995, partial [Lewinella sp.]|nr:hypothetical protein [Lewinella sp.]